MATSASAFDELVGDKQLADYRRDGFIVVDEIYCEDDIQRMRDALEELIAGAAGLLEHNEVYDLEPGHAPDNPRVRRIKLPYKVHPVFDEMARHPRLLAVMRQLIGPDLRLHGGKINLKSASYGAAVEWHQDWAFYPHSNDDVLAAGVMLDDMTPDNGPLLIVPGSHCGPTFDHHQDGHFVGAIDPTVPGLNPQSARMATGRAGACSFHHVRAVHGSAQNTSGADRRLLLYQVAAGDAWDFRGLTEGSWEAHLASMLCGEPSIQPRVVPAPVRLPYPPPLRSGSIYESQSLLRHRYFADETADVDSE